MFKTKFRSSTLLVYTSRSSSSYLVPSLPHIPSLFIHFGVDPSSCLIAISGHMPYFDSERSFPLL